jgi:N-acetylneuraminic acid mutarotase
MKHILALTLASVRRSSLKNAMPRTVCPLGTVVLILASLALTGCQEDPTGPTPEPGAPVAAVAAAERWLPRADYPTDIWEAASASITTPATLRTILYVIGGRPKEFGSAGQITSAVKAYDVSANVWQAKAPYPVRIRATNGAVEINGKIYVSGGFTRRWDEQHGVWRLQTVKSLYVYDPATNTWTRRRDMPITTVQGVSAAYKGLLYVATDCFDEVVCGEQDDRGALWRYNPSTDRWVLLSRRTTTILGWSGGGFVGGKLYLVDELGELDIYDVATNRWSSGPRRPFRRCSPASTTLQAKLYLVGCHDDDDESGVWPMLVFDPKVGSWSQAMAPPVAATGDRWTLSRVVANGRPRLELVGGARPGNNWQYVP